ncbi:MAG: hypothetical protein M0P13_12570 [Fibrobacteraceae bacterium]|nr:hypothetical protein [Fibrobacteraceae bacterium]
MNKKMLLISVCAVVLLSCALPRTVVKETRFVNSKPLANNSVNSKDSVAVYENEYPEGVEKNGDLFRVERGYENKISILGEFTLNLQPGRLTGPFIYPYMNLYVKEEDLSWLNTYCMDISVLGLTLNIFSYVLPWNWPCYGLTDRGYNTPEDIDYRTEVLKDKAKEAALKMGGNAVVGFHVEGVTIIDARTNSALANTFAWSAGGYVISIKP